MSTQPGKSMSGDYVFNHDILNTQIQQLMEHTSQVSAEQLAQQRAYKAAKESFRNTIKELVTNQKLQKINRRPDTSGSTELQSRAQATHAINRSELRHLYLAYAIMRTQYGGYTKKLPCTFKTKCAKPGETVADSVLSGNSRVVGIDHNYLTQILEKHGPKTVHLSS